MVWEPIYVLLLLASTSVDWFSSVQMVKTDNKIKRRLLVLLSLVTNLGLLFFFKYYDFVASNLNATGWVSLPMLHLVLPPGISFYTFHALCYTIDVYRSKLKPEMSFGFFTLYITFFPQLVAGPIARPALLIPQLREKHNIDLKRIADGLMLMLWGLVIKILIADKLAPIVDQIFSDVRSHQGMPLLKANYYFAIQIYCDFAGYSMVALGSAKVLGFTLMRNFDSPYLTRNISEFWRHWHISLSTWFRDYVFSPYYMYLNKTPSLQKFDLKTRHNIAFLTTLFLTEILLGFWHGANWNFGLFGVYHAVLIGGYYFSRNYWNRMPDYLQLFLTFQLAVIGFVIFRITNLSDLGYVLTHSLTSISAVALFVSVAIPLILLDLATKHLKRWLDAFRASQFATVGIFIFWFYALIYITFVSSEVFGSNRPFIYFQF